MATGGGGCGGPPPSSHEDRRQSLTCTLCLDIFSLPTLLPCHHTFCLRCLLALTSRQPSPTFPCPQCRSEVTVPAEGVEAFQSNFYIRPEDLDIARGGTQCLTHPEQEIDLHCVDCQLPACLKCALTEHGQHRTQKLSDAATEARVQLSQDEERLQKAVGCMIEEVDAERSEQQSLQDKKAAVETIIRNKHATLVALADRYRDKLLASVGTVCDQEEVITTLDSKANDLQDLCQLQQRLEETLSSGTACTQVTMAKEMREGKGSAQTLDNMTWSRRSTVRRPVLSSTFSLDTLIRNVQGFFGTVETVEMTLTPEEVAVAERFTCRQEEDTEVYSLCPADDGTVQVSYANCGLQNKAASDSFQENGEHKGTCENASGKCSWKSRGQGKHMFLRPSQVEINTYSKHKGHYNYHLKLCNSLQGRADFERETVTSVNPFTAESITEFTINVGPHKAFDVNSSEQFFAVVEEPQVPDQQREVRLYRRNNPDAVDTYVSPTRPFNPSDVCFFTLGNKEALMIADEAGDSIHVVHVQAGTLIFARHLAPGCPQLVQPTAVNIDHLGLLWVACRGGRILTMMPVTSSLSSSSSVQ